MKNLLKLNKEYFEKTPLNSLYPTILKNIVSELNKKGIILISGLIGSNKLGVIKEVISKTKMQKNFFYFNGVLDINNQIKGYKSLAHMYEGEKIIILENIDEIDKAEIFVKEQLKASKKIILIGNAIKMKGVPEIEILPNITHPLNFYTDLINNKNQKNNYIELLTHTIITKDIFIKHKIKNFSLLQNIIQLLSQTSSLSSVRELHGILEKKSIKISQITLLEYIDYILGSKLVKKVLRYDIKTKKSSTGKAKYFFTDTQIRNICVAYTLDKYTLSQNLIFQKLEKLGGRIFTGKNGKFDFSFITKELNKNLIIHVSGYTDKNEVKKEAKKLLKVPGDYQKYLLVHSIKEIGIRPSTYEPLKIMEIGDFLKN